MIRLKLHLHIYEIYEKECAIQRHINYWLISDSKTGDINLIQCTSKKLYWRTFCGEYEESLKHSFLHCQFSKNLWMQIVSCLNEFNITIIELKDSEIMLGYTNESPHWTFLKDGSYFC